VGTGSDVEPDRRHLRRVLTRDLTASEAAAIRALMVVAFGSDDDERFTDDDWDHATGGVHFVLESHGELIAHASVVERELEVGGVRLTTGYVEAVATAPPRQGVGFGSQVMADVTTYIRDEFALGALGTGRHGFYERLGWLTWIGPSSVRTAEGIRPTPDDDGYILVLRTPASPALDLATPITCDWRSGDVW